MGKQYPRIEGRRRKPNPEKDGTKNHGKPCVFCGKGTIGEKWVQFNYMRGEDETVRVCFDHWKESDDAVLAAIGITCTNNLER
jgi:hypothetical protein